MGNKKVDSSNDDIVLKLPISSVQYLRDGETGEPIYALSFDSVIVDEPTRMALTLLEDDMSFWVQVVKR